MCKSKQYTKMKCPNKDRVVEPTPKRPKGRPRKDGTPPSSSQVGSSSANLGATTLPTRIGRGGRVIRGGRGSRGGRRNAGLNVPTRFRVFIAHAGTCMTNVSLYFIFVILYIYLWISLTIFYVFFNSVV